MRHRCWWWVPLVGTGWPAGWYLCVRAGQPTEKVPPVHIRGMSAIRRQLGSINHRVDEHRGRLGAAADADWRPERLVARSPSPGARRDKQNQAANELTNMKSKPSKPQPTAASTTSRGDDVNKATSITANKCANARRREAEGRSRARASCHVPTPLTQTSGWPPAGVYSVESRYKRRYSGRAAGAGAGARCWCRYKHQETSLRCSSQRASREP